MSRICIVVLTWNAPTRTLQCLDSLLPVLAQGHATLVVCDNDLGSELLSQLHDWARTQFVPSEIGSADLVLIENGANLGYAAGNNVGIRWAMEHGGFDAVWLLNPDCRVDANALLALQRCAAAHPRAALIGSTLLDDDGSGHIQYAGGARYHPLLTWFHPIHRGQPVERVDALPTALLDYVSGAAQYIRLSALADLGLLSEDYFLFYEELDLAQRIKAEGWQLHWCRESLVWHRGGVSTGADPVSTAYHENLSTLIFTAQHHPGLLIPAALIRTGVKAWLAAVRFDTQIWRALWRAYGDFFVGGLRRWPKPANEPRIIFSGRLPSD